MLKKCLFPVAGYGTRFLPATKAMPKEMLPVVNKPLVQYGVEEALAAGLDEICFVTGRGKRAIHDHFDISYELEHQIAGTDKESYLVGIREIIQRGRFASTRQLEMKGLGHAILTGELLIGNQPFGVVLADDLCFNEGPGVMEQLVAIYRRTGNTVIAIEEVAEEDVGKFGIVAGEEVEPGLYRVTDMVEKPQPDQAPSNLAIIGRYVLSPFIFELLRHTPPGKNGEIQLTDALLALARTSKVLAYKFQGRRFDCGSVGGFVEATNHVYQNVYRRGRVMVGRIDCFKAYDVRGRVPDQLNEDVAYRIGRAFATWRQARSIAVGHDIRLTSPALCAAAIEGIRDAGSDAVHIGQCGTEEIYFATFHGGHDGGLVVTASHNPKDFNGMKFVREGARPVSGDAGLPEIQALAEAGFGTPAARRGELHQAPDKRAYIDHLLSYIDPAALRPLRVVVNAGNGGAGPVVDLLEPHLPLEFIKLQHQPDGHFPNGVPNPLLEENRQVTADAVRAQGADLGIAWDGDFDRCFFFDEQGEFVEGYYVVGLLAEAFLRKHGAGAIVHDPRLIWNTQDIVARLGGRAVQSRTGHAFIKQVMRDHDALYGGEMSAHHYFRDFAYCDSGMIPWLLVVELLSQRGQPLSALLAERQRAYPVSGEINREVADPAAAIAAAEARYAAQGGVVDRTDGVGISFAEWRFNLRMSNTEPLVRLNVETRGDPALLAAKTAELLALLDGRT